MRKCIILCLILIITIAVSGCSFEIGAAEKKKNLLRATNKSVAECVLSKADKSYNENVPEVSIIKKSWDAAYNIIDSIKNTDFDAFISMLKGMDPGEETKNNIVNSITNSEYAKIAGDLTRDCFNDCKDIIQNDFGNMIRTEIQKFKNLEY